MSAPDDASRRRFTLVLAITFSRIPLAVLFAAVQILLAPDLLRVGLGLGLILLMEASDLLDGILARKYAVTSELGAMSDPYSDSTSRLIVFWAFACEGSALAFVPLVMALRDVTVAYSRILLTRYGRSVRANCSGKTKAAVQASAAIGLVLSPLVLEYTGAWPRIALSWIVAVVTAASAVQYVAAAFAARGAIRGPGEDEPPPPRSPDPRPTE
jgi:CDP-diacylglycerol--glycerol-3-phosphate 3-phosphatidyltransferase